MSTCCGATEIIRDTEPDRISRTRARGVHALIEAKEERRTRIRRVHGT